MSISHLVYNGQAIKSIGLLPNAGFVSFTEEKAKQTIQILSYSRENCLLSKMHLQKQMLFSCSCLGAAFGACLEPACMHMSQSPPWNTQLSQDLRNHSTFFLEHLLSNTSEVTNGRHSIPQKYDGTMFEELSQAVQLFPCTLFLQASFTSFLLETIKHPGGILCELSPVKMRSRA